MMTYLLLDIDLSETWIKIQQLFSYNKIYLQNHLPWYIKVSLEKFPYRDSKVHGANVGSCRPQVSPMLAPWTLLSGYISVWQATKFTRNTQHTNPSHMVLAFSGKPGSQFDFIWIMSWNGRMPNPCLCNDGTWHTPATSIGSVRMELR